MQHLNVFVMILAQWCVSFVLSDASVFIVYFVLSAVWSYTLFCCQKPASYTTTCLRSEVRRKFMCSL